MGLPKRDQSLYILKQRIVCLKAAPVHPPCLIVLTIHVVVSFLGIIKLVPRQQAGRPLCRKEKEERISYLIFPQLCHRALTAGAFCPAVPAIIVIRSVRIIFSVCLIVLAVVRDKIPECKSGLPRDIIAFPVRRRVVLKRPHYVIDHIFVAF